MPMTENELAEAWDEVERLRGVVERLVLENWELRDQLNDLVRLRGLSKGTWATVGADDTSRTAARTRGEP